MTWLIILVTLTAGSSSATTIPGEYQSREACETAAIPLREARDPWDAEVICVPTPLPQ